MLRSFDTSVLIVGAGPVGLTLAMELASRGVDVTVTEPASRRTSSATPTGSETPVCRRNIAMT